jgi:Fur family ferric uptake transcriptional regulator
MTSSAGFLTAKLASSDLKTTRQRKFIIQRMESFSKPFSAEDLFSQGPKPPGLDLATVYRTLNLFHERSWISKMDLKDGHVRYILNLKESHTHTLLCQSCQQVEQLPGCFVGPQEAEIKKLGFQIFSHKVEFFGLCPHCRTHRNSRQKERRR